MAFQSKKGVSRHFILWLSTVVDFSVVRKIIDEELDCEKGGKKNPVLLVLAQGSEQVTLSLSFNEPLSSL